MAKNTMTKQQFLKASEALYDALEAAGGDKGGGRVIADACGISQQAVSGWRYVPTKHVSTVSEKTGISRARLRPDVFGG